MKCMWRTDALPAYFLHVNIWIRYITLPRGSFKSFAKINSQRRQGLMYAVPSKPRLWLLKCFSHFPSYWWQSVNECVACECLMHCLIKTLWHVDDHVFNEYHIWCLIKPLWCYVDFIVLWSTLNEPHKEEKKASSQKEAHFLLCIGSSPLAMWLLYTHRLISS